MQVRFSGSGINKQVRIWISIKKYQVHGLFCSIFSSTVLVRREPGRLLTKTQFDIDIRRHSIYPYWTPESIIPT